MSKASDRISKAKVRLQMHYPFYATLALYLPGYETNSVPTMGTDGKVLAYNPEFVKTLNDDQLLGVLVHEVLHVVFLHPSERRRGTRNALIWNVAADYLVNRIVVDEEHLSLPPGCLIAEPADLPHTMTTEELYAKIYEEAKKHPNQQPKRGEGADDHSGWGKKGYGTEEGDGEAAEGEDAAKADGEAPAPAAFDEAAWKDKIARATMAARMQGKLPAFLEQAIADSLNPPLDWRVILRDWIEALIKSDYRLSPPNRRFLWFPLFMPALAIEDEGRVEGVVAIDTSGSVTDDEIAEFVGNVRGVTEQFADYKLTVIQCDAAVSDVCTITPYEGEVPTKAKGRGGTSFRPPFDYILQHQLKVPWMVYFTDGYGDFPRVPPDWPVIWVMTSAVAPPFGQQIKLRLPPRS